MPYVYRDRLPLCSASGVYAIINISNGKAYIGSSLSIRGRLLMHRSGLRRGIHDNQYLQNAWSKYGEASFQFKVLETCEPGDVLIREQVWIDNLQTTDRDVGYNIALFATESPMTGRNHSEESRAKMSKQRKGTDTSKATAAAAKVNKGKKQSAETCAKKSARHWTKRRTPEEVSAAMKKAAQTRWGKSHLNGIMHATTS